MIEKIKYRLSGIFNSRRIRVQCIAVMSALTIAVTTLLGCSINTVKIFDGQTTYIVHTLDNNIVATVSGFKFKSDKYNIVNTSLKNGYTSIEIEYTFPVYITQGDNTFEVEFSGGTVADALKLAGLTIDEFDFVEPSADTVINETQYIDYTDVDYVDGSYNEAIPHVVETVYSSNNLKGTTSLVSGNDGVQQINYTDKLINGISVEKIITGTTVLENAVNAKKIIGTKTVPTVVKAATAVTTSSNVKCVSTLTPASAIKLDGNGNPVNYKSKMTARATAYTYTGNNCATGVAPQPGYIAVNPNVIPYGTKMYIKTADGKFIYGYAVAADTGGFVKWSPNGVDLFMSSKSACTSFGVRNVEIYILE